MCKFYLTCKKCTKEKVQLKDNSWTSTFNQDVTSQRVLFIFGIGQCSYNFAWF